MLPVSAWPPGPPGASLSPFGKPRPINLGCHPHGYVIPKGAWVVKTAGNRVVMFFPREDPWNGVQRTPGTGFLPGQIPPPRHPPKAPCSPSAASRVAPPAKNVAIAAPCPPAPCSPKPWRFRKHNTVLEDWRAWQREIGRTPPPIRPTPGRRPPNWFGWKYVCAPSTTLVQPFSGGLVVADGQNVVIAGGGCATITQAYSV